MATLWLFGDSNTALYTHDTIERSEYMIGYSKYLGYLPKHFSLMLGESLNMEVANRGVGGVDNSFILETIIKELDNFKKGDIILIGWTDPLRFRIADKQGFLFILPNNIPKIEDISEECLMSLNLNRTNDLFVIETLNWTKLLKFALKDFDVIPWSFISVLKDREDILNVVKIAAHYDFGYLSPIKNETNGIVDDGHLGEKGNLTLYKSLLHYIQNRENEDYFLNKNYPKNKKSLL